MNAGKRISINSRVFGVVTLLALAASFSFRNFGETQERTEQSSTGDGKLVMGKKSSSRSIASGTERDDFQLAFRESLGFFDDISAVNWQRMKNISKGRVHHSKMYHKKEMNEPKLTPRARKFIMQAIGILTFPASPKTASAKPNPMVTNGSETLIASRTNRIVSSTALDRMANLILSWIYNVVCPIVRSMSSIRPIILEKCGKAGSTVPITTRGASNQVLDRLFVSGKNSRVFAF